MSLLIDVAKGVQGKSIEKVANGIRNTRLNMCNSCPHLVNGTRSCGTFMLGGIAVYKGEMYDLCGCNIDDKTKYKDDGCPLGKW